MFTHNHLNGYEIPDITLERVRDIFRYNCFGYHSKYSKMQSLYPFIAFLNHGRAQNVVWYDFKESGYKLIFANQNIPAGAAIEYDYIGIIKDKVKRKNILLNTWGITQD